MTGVVSLAVCVYRRIETSSAHPWEVSCVWCLVSQSCWCGVYIRVRRQRIVGFPYPYTFNPGLDPLSRPSLARTYSSAPYGRIVYILACPACRRHYRHTAPANLVLVGSGWWWSWWWLRPALDSSTNLQSTPVPRSARLDCPCHVSLCPSPPPGIARTTTWMGANGGRVNSGSNS